MLKFLILILLLITTPLLSADNIDSQENEISDFQFYKIIFILVIGFILLGHSSFWPFILIIWVLSICNIIFVPDDLTLAFGITVGLLMVAFSKPDKSQ